MANPVIPDPLQDAGSETGEKTETQNAASRLLANLTFSESTYKVDDRYQPWDGKDVLGIHSVPELLEAAEKGKVEVDARILAFAPGAKKRTHVRYDAKSLVEANRKPVALNFREATDLFAYDMEDRGGGQVGQDFLPLLGGPFNKQLYYYDYMRMHALAFQAYNHDPMARAIVGITVDFTLGRGFRVDCQSTKHLAIWRAFEEVNDLQNLMKQIATELSMYGEVMPWFLPNNETKIAYDVRPGQEPTKGFLPRVRLIDPSVIWDIITYPEDITRVLAYQWVAPTQYQTYTAKDGGSAVPSTKFIYQQIPADEVLHYKINCVSNEKRGRSDLFPVLGYMKRLRDSVQYSVIAAQKQSAWAIDTTVKGSKTDVDNYCNSISGSQSIAAAGSEFVHNEQVTRQFLSNASGKAGGSDSFEWCLSMIAAGSGIPVQYFGTHLSGATTRASALVATEPVAKKFEMRQADYERIVKSMASKLWAMLKMPQVDIEITFPELVVQDRSAKVRDLAAGEAAGWISRKRAAEIYAREMGITEYDYDSERVDIEQEQGPAGNPLTAMGKNLTTTMNDLIKSGDGAPGMLPAGSPDSAAAPAAAPAPKEQPMGVSSEMRKQVAGSK